MNCFAVNETTNRNVLTFADDREFNVRIQTIYFYWNLTFSCSCMILNALLCTAIIRFPNPLIKISPMLFVNTIIDFLFASFSFFFGSSIFVGYNRGFIIYDGLINISDPRIARGVFIFSSILAVATWKVIVAQFVYRLLLVRYNEKPRGRRLYCFLIFFFVLGASHILAFIIEGNAYKLSTEDIEDTSNILAHYGFDVHSAYFIGRVFKPHQKSTILDTLLIFFPVLGFTLIFFCAIAIHQLLHRRSHTNHYERITDCCIFLSFPSM
ncbi:hypothetical protein M3Y95_00338700 [Aphelenchoides besseyi]|nr:hypothetical protein M3Y95_00338700 [Aphelenchoides besseyi]